MIRKCSVRCAMKRLLFFLSVLTLVCCCVSALAGYHLNDQGLYVDDSGQVIAELWDEAAGLYIVGGVAYKIETVDSGESGSGTSSGDPSGSGAITIPSSDGSEDPTAGMTKNPDGSVTVESGQIQIDDPGAEGSGSHLTQAEWEARWAKYTAKNGVTTGTVYMDGSGNTWPAEIVYLGLGRSTIRVDGKERIVPTCTLKWDTDAPENKILAVVTPSTQTYLTLRAKKSQKSFVLGHCEKCRVLRVIKTGKTWTMVDDNGVRGYVLSSGLTFYDNAPRQYAAGIITVKGKTPRGNTVHIRSSNSNKARQIDEFPVGTSITVFSQEGRWSEIDVAGWHCYILSEFVTLQEPLITADADPGAGAESEH